MSAGDERIPTLKTDCDGRVFALAAMMLFVLFVLNPAVHAEQDSLLAGYVVDASGEPVAAAYVHLLSERGVRATATDENGRYSFRVSGGAYRVHVTLDSWRISDPQAIVIVDGQPEDLDVVVDPSRAPRPLDLERLSEQTSNAVFDFPRSRRWVLLEFGSSTEDAPLLIVRGNGMVTVTRTDRPSTSSQLSRDELDGLVHFLLAMGIAETDRVLLEDRAENLRGQRRPGRTHISSGAGSSWLSFNLTKYAVIGSLEARRIRSHVVLKDPIDRSTSTPEGEALRKLAVVVKTLAALRRASE